MNEQYDDLDGEEIIDKPNMRILQLYNNVSKVGNENGRNYNDKTSSYLLIQTQGTFTRQSIQMGYWI